MLDKLKYKYFREGETSIQDVLLQNYPNPFNQETVINYQISSAGNVRIAVFDILGRETSVLVNEIQQPGYYSAKFSSVQLQLPTGIYFYRLKTNKAVLTRKMMLVN